MTEALSNQLLATAISKIIPCRMLLIRANRPSSKTMEKWKCSSLSQQFPAVLVRIWVRHWNSSAFSNFHEDLENPAADSLTHDDSPLSPGELQPLNSRTNTSKLPFKCINSWWHKPLAPVCGFQITPHISQDVSVIAQTLKNCHCPRCVTKRPGESWSHLGWKGPQDPWVQTLTQHKYSLCFPQNMEFSHFRYVGFSRRTSLGHFSMHWQEKNLIFHKNLLLRQDKSKEGAPPDTVNTQMLKAADLREKTEVTQHKGKGSTRDRMQNHRWPRVKNTQETDESWRLLREQSRNAWAEVGNQEFSCVQQALNSRAVLVSSDLATGIYLWDGRQRDR